MIVLSPVVAMGSTDLELLTLKPAYRSSSSVFGSLSVMATDSASPVVHLRVVDSPLTIMSSAVSNSRMLGLGATSASTVSVTAPPRPTAVRV